MHTIILGASALSERLSMALYRIFERQGGALVLSQQKIFGSARGYKVLIALAGEATVVEAEGALVLLPADSHPPILRCPVTLVADSARQSWPRPLHGQLISCGFSAKDTFTLSSRTEDSAVVALMRRVYSLTGQVVDPCEVPIGFGQDDPFIAFGVVSTLLLTENTHILEVLGPETNNLQL